MLNRESGLKGICGINDMREIEGRAKGGDAQAELAVGMFCYRVKKYIGSYLAAMNGADAIVFAGGIGENSPEIRARICAGLEWLGIEIDSARNGGVVGTEGRIDRDKSRVNLWVIPTDEELLIARDTWRVVTGAEVPY